MRSYFYLFILLLTLVLVGCDDDCNELSGMPSNMLQQANMMGFKGRVKHIQVYNTKDDLMLLEAEFDESGRCLYWNDTGVGVESVNTVSRGISSGWIYAPASYTYHYNRQGQLVAVDQATLGAEIEHYRISYGNHDLVMALPFPIGPFCHYLVKGISKIESENFLLSCDGRTAHSERQTLAWMSLTELNEYQFENHRLSEKTMRLYCRRGEGEKQQIERVRTFYEYNGKQLERVLSVAVDSEDYQEKVETVYGLSYSLLPTKKRLYVGVSFEPLYETTYQYNAQGSIVSVLNTIGDDYFEPSYHQQFLTYDEFGNWQTAIRNTNYESMPLEQKITYW